MAGVRVTVPMGFADGAPDPWADSIFAAAGVPVKAEDALTPHKQALRAGLSSVAAEERQKARKQAEEGRQQSRTANRQARAGSGEWDRALAKIHTGSVREARMSRA